MDDFAHRRVHGQRKALRYGVADRHEAEGHARKREIVPGVDRDKVGAIKDAPLAQLVADKREGEGRAVDRQPPGESHKPRRRADMIFMPMRENNAGEPFSPGQNGVQRGNDCVYAQLLFIGEHDSAINKHGTFGRIPDLTVQADFAKPSQGRYGQVRIRHAPPDARAPRAGRKPRFPASGLLVQNQVNLINRLLQCRLVASGGVARSALTVRAIQLRPMCALPAGNIRFLADGVFMRSAPGFQARHAAR